jgi:hypothetical protein
MNVVSSPAWVYNDGMGRNKRPTGDDQNELGKTEHDYGQGRSPRQSRGELTILLFHNCSSAWTASSAQSDGGLTTTTQSRQAGRQIDRRTGSGGGGGNGHLWGCTTWLAVPRATQPLYSKRRAGCKWSLRRTNEEGKAAPPRRASQVHVSPQKVEALKMQRIGPGLAYWLDRGGQPLRRADASLYGREGTPQDGRGQMASIEAKLLVAVNGQAGVMSAAGQKPSAKGPLNSPLSAQLPLLHSLTHSNLALPACLSRDNISRDSVTKA